MRKSLLVPLVSLSRLEERACLEFYVEPALGWQGFFCPLRVMGLERAVGLASRALALLPTPRFRTAVYLGSPPHSLSNVAGLALGLVLARFLLEASCPYERLIVTGVISDLEGTSSSTPVLDSGHLQARLKAVLDLGIATERTLFILPRLPVPHQGDEALLGRLPLRNVYVQPVGTLEEAYRACLAVPAHTKV